MSPSAITTFELLALISGAETVQIKQDQFAGWRGLESFVVIGLITLREFYIS
jgi:hypothetical protein